VNSSELLIKKIEDLEAEVAQLAKENHRLHQRLQRLKENKPVQTEIETQPDAEDLRCAEQMLQIKQQLFPNCRCNLNKWGLEIATYLPSRLVLDGETRILDKETFVRAFHYAHKINDFWARNRIISSPATLKTQLLRKRRATFKTEFFAWLDGGEIEKSIRHSKGNAQEVVKQAVRETFSNISRDIES
jgi:hypothetical protein